jgi:hypothetical protein
MLKNLCSLSSRGAAGGEESRKPFVSRARFLVQFTLNGQGEIPLPQGGIGMTVKGSE